MSESSRGCRGRSLQLLGLLTQFLHPDVIPLVLGYEATIRFELQRIYDGKLLGRQERRGNGPGGLALHDHELFVIDAWNHRIQVFSQMTGRFLRCWGRSGRRDGEFERLTCSALCIGLEVAGDDNRQHSPSQIFITDRDQVQVFRIHDAQFLRRFSIPHIPHEAARPWCGGIVVVADQLYVFRSNPHQIDVIKTDKGNRIKFFSLEEPRTPSRYPGMLFFDAVANELFVGDAGNDRVVALDMASGHFLRKYGVSDDSSQYDLLQAPRAVVVHGEEIIVSDSWNNRLVVFERSTGQKLRSFNSVHSAGITIKFELPGDLVVSDGNELFVADPVNDRVLVFH